jgi:hypothetical protein
VTALPDPAEQPTVPLWPGAGRALGLGRSATFAAHRRGEIPWPVWKIAGRLVCPTAAVRLALGLDGDRENGGGDAPS